MFSFNVGHVNPNNRFHLFKMNGNFRESVTNYSGWCRPVGTVNFIATGVYATGFRSSFWAQASNANGSNYLTWSPTLLSRNYGTQEIVVQATGAVTVKQMGVSAYDGGTRWWEPAKTVLNSQQAYLINVSDSTGAGGQPYVNPNRVYFLSSYSPNKAIQKAYTLDINNNLTLRDTITKTNTLLNLTNPKWSTVTLYSHVFSFKSFNNLDNHAGFIQYVKFSRTYTETPTYSSQDI